jgi:hypothetical protein
MEMKRKVRARRTWTCLWLMVEMTTGTQEMIMKMKIQLSLKRRANDLKSKLVNTSRPRHTRLSESFLPILLGSTCPKSTP